MAKKTKQRRKPAAPRRPVPTGGTSTTEGRSVAPGAPVPSGGGTPPRRGVERVDPAAARRTQATRAGKADPGFAPLEPDDPAIPFDRVPYVRRDLRRVAAMAAVMVVLVVVANLILSKLTG